MARAREISPGRLDRAAAPPHRDGLLGEPDDHSRPSPLAPVPTWRLVRAGGAAGIGGDRQRHRQPAAAHGRAQPATHRRVAERPCPASGRVRPCRNRVDPARPAAAAGQPAGGRCGQSAALGRCRDPGLAIRRVAAGAFLHRVAGARAGPDPAARPGRPLERAWPAWPAAGAGRSVRHPGAAGRVAGVACAPAGVGTGTRHRRGGAADRVAHARRRQPHPRRCQGMVAHRWHAAGDRARFRPQQRRWPRLCGHPQGRLGRVRRQRARCRHRTRVRARAAPGVGCAGRTSGGGGACRYCAGRRGPARYSQPTRASRADSRGGNRQHGCALGWQHPPVARCGIAAAHRWWRPQAGAGWHRGGWRATLRRAGRTH